MEVGGDYDIPFQFMAYMFKGCPNYNQLDEDIFNLSWLNFNFVDREFFYETWRSCTGLLKMPYIKWPQKYPNNISLNYNFFRSTFESCYNLTEAIFDPYFAASKYIHPDSFFNSTLSKCSFLSKVVFPNTLYWGQLSSSTPNSWPFNLTFNYSSSSSNQIDVTIYGNWPGLYARLQTNSMGLNNNYVTNIHVKSEYLDDYKNSSYWSNITDSKFIPI
jgi:hypothetical protein